MKEHPEIIILVRETENRLPKKGDLLVDGQGLCIAQFDFESNKQPCYTRRDIPRPEGAKILQYCFDNTIGHKEIPLPKRKVKKTFWVNCYQRVTGEIYTGTQTYSSENEASSGHSGGGRIFIATVPVEIEVEE